jgi:hypothetical protein
VRSPGLELGAMRRYSVVLFAMGMLLLGVAFAQEDDEPVATLYFVILKDYNGKPIRNASVVLHPVKRDGKQERGGLELKADAEGRAAYDGIPYGKLRVQVLATGFQTYGQDYEVDKPKLDIVIKLKRPQGQYSIYEDHPEDKKPEDKKDDKKSEQPPPK